MLFQDDSRDISYLLFFENIKRCPKICRLLQSWLALYGLINIEFTNFKNMKQKLSLALDRSTESKFRKGPCLSSLLKEDFFQVYQF